MGFSKKTVRDMDFCFFYGGNIIFSLPSNGKKALSLMIMELSFFLSWKLEFFAGYVSEKLKWIELRTKQLFKIFLGS